MISVPDSYSVRRLARVVIEFTTPFHVGSGRGGDGLDALVVTDANGLPTIPGSSLAGALRAAFLRATGDAAAVAELFGDQVLDSGRGSRLTVSWACLHDQTDHPVEALRDLDPQDEVLGDALGRHFRDHVRLNDRGAAAHHGKFDERHVGAGHRFTFELELADRPDDNADWQRLLAILVSGELRLGGKTRRGYGAFKVVRLSAASFDLDVREQFEAYANHPAALVEDAPDLGEPPDSASVSDGTQVVLTLNVQPRGYWMFGGGEDLDRDAPVDMAPLRDSRIVWTGTTGSVEDEVLVLPATAIKGALAHRVAFHWNRIKGRFADAKDGEPAAELGENNPAVRELFGWRADKGGGRRGRLLMDDTFWPVSEPTQQRVPHVSIDRFTGGASDGKLFDERPLWRGDFPPLTLTLTDAAGLSATTKQALRAALEDLCEGRLALGAGGGRGLGYFETRPAVIPLECSTGDAWFFAAQDESLQP